MGKKKDPKEVHCGAGTTFNVGRAVYACAHVNPPPSPSLSLFLRSRLSSVNALTLSYASLVFAGSHKEFKGFGIFVGRVADFHPTTGYRIEYEDGDSEDLTEAGLAALLASGPHPCLAMQALAAEEAPSQLSKRSAPPALSLREYVSCARTAARRKRKHTDMKRSGMFERKRLELEAAREAAAREAAARLPLHPPPSWAEGLAREGRVVRCDGVPDVEPMLHDHDITLFRLRLTSLSATALGVQWWFPPANPGDSGAWIGLFRHSAVDWGADGSPYGLVSSGSENRMLYRLLTRNDTSGMAKFSALSNLKDDDYVFTLHADYGRQCRAGLVVEVYEGGHCSDFPAPNRKHRQQNASLNLLRHIHRSRDDEAEEIDERCYFPLVNVDLTLPERYLENTPLLKRIYHVVDKASYLDWGLTSDYDTVDAGAGEDAGGDNHRLRERRMISENEGLGANAVVGKGSSQYSSDLPSAAQHATRRVGVNGSEGYGEATVGSAHKLALVLTHLRHLVLQDLHDTHWGLLWDLGPHSTFVDIGSGYGKVVMHFRLMCRMRKAVGVECVASRDHIAKQALFSLEAEVGADASLGGASDDSESTRPGSALTDSADEHPPPRLVKSGPFDGVEFCKKDATLDRELPYTHIYIFDWVFARETLASMAKVLQRSPFYVLLSFRKVTEWWSYGLVKIQPVAKLQGFRTTGGEGMTCFVYVNVEKLPTQ